MSSPSYSNTPILNFEPARPANFLRPRKSLSWAPVFVNAFLDRQQELGGALDFVDDRTIQAANQTDRIFASGQQGEVVVEREVTKPPIRHLAHQRGLAGLTRPGQKDHRGVQHRLGDPGLDPSGEQRWGGHARRYPSLGAHAGLNLVDPCSIRSF